MNAQVMPCGCVKGVRLCREGQQLHDDMMAKWRALQHLPPDDKRWAPYDEARDRLDIHLGNEPIGCTR
jgi:hypothetical protein